MYADKSSEISPDTLTGRYVPDMAAWSFRGHDPGPAGTSSVLLSAEVRLSVDAADPSRVVEFCVVHDEARPTEESIALTRLMLGDTAADFLVEADIDSPGPVIDVEPSAPLRSAIALAVALFAQADRHLAHPMRLCDVALHANRIPAPAATAMAVDSAMRVWPTAIYLARACADEPSPTSGLDQTTRHQLRDRLLVLLGLMAEADPDMTETRAYDLVAELAASLGEPTLDLLSEVDVGAEFEALGRLFTAATDLPPTPADRAQPLVVAGRLTRSAPNESDPIPLRWRGRVDNFADRLGRHIRLFHLGQIQADGYAPGMLVVTIPVALGVQTADLADIRVRAVTTEGWLAGEAGLHIEANGDALPVARSDIALSGLADGHLYSRIVIDLAPAQLPSPDSEVLRRIARLEGYRAGQAAVAATIAGDSDVASAWWRECADTLREVDEHELAAQASAYAQAVSTQPTAARNQDWLTALLSRWASWTHDTLGAIRSDAPDPTAVGRLREVIDRLSGWHPRSAELAQAHVDLGRVLRLNPAAAQYAGEDEDELRFAMSLYYDLGLDWQALQCLRELSS